MDNKSYIKGKPMQQSLYNCTKSTIKMHRFEHFCTFTCPVQDLLNQDKQPPATFHEHVFNELIYTPTQPKSFSYLSAI
jgi:hypothetical protein